MTLDEFEEEIRNYLIEKKFTSTGTWFVVSTHGRYKEKSVNVCVPSIGLSYMGVGKTYAEAFKLCMISIKRNL